MSLLGWFFKPVEFLRDEDRVIDVWSFKAQERLRIHEARTEAENVSSPRGGYRPVRRWRIVRRQTAV